MQLTIADAAKKKLLKDARMTMPSVLLPSSISGKDVDIKTFNSGYAAENVLVELWNRQHPLIHAWLLLSSISICFLSALFFVYP